nr:hypothetical protein [uncultured Catonella sp.]
MSNRKLILIVMTNKLVLNKPYTLANIYKIVEQDPTTKNIDDLRHQIRALLQKRKPSGYYFNYKRPGIYLLTK